MNDSYPPRVGGLPIDFVRDRLRAFLRSREEELPSIWEAPKDSLQGKMFSLYLNCEHIAFYRYALGHPFDQVRQAFSEAAAAMLQVFELREGTRDESYTSSRHCFDGMCCAWAAWEYGIADQLARRMADPPGARYISVHSEYHTPNRISLAYTVKHLLLNNREEARREVMRIRARRPSRDPETKPMAETVRGLIDESDVIFFEGLQELLRWHRKRLKEPLDILNPETYFCLPAVALSNWGAYRRVLKKKDMPLDPYLPLELIAET
jgi:hypothetical protein